MARIFTDTQGALLCVGAAGINVGFYVWCGSTFNAVIAAFALVVALTVLLGEETEVNTKVLPCGCRSDYQDQRYGQGRRLHNRYEKPSPGGWRCTVCEAKK